MNLPNALTLGRIFLVPLLVVVLLTKFDGRLIFGVRKELVGAAIFGIASLTDWLDGYLARRRKQITTLGQLMDPLADKLLITAALVSLVQMDLAPAWVVAVILGREFLVTVLRSIAHARGVVIAASPLGKFKMASQVIAILLLILGRDHLQQFFVLGRIALWIAVVTAVASGVDYYRRFNHVLTGSRKPEDLVVPPCSPQARASKSPMWDSRPSPDASKWDVLLHVVHPLRCRGCGTGTERPEDAPLNQRVRSSSRAPSIAAGSRRCLG
jgi:CDP-diacylglycerol--glycerol-3-phosphate 3-phosphatidyltransferase